MKAMTKAMYGWLLASILMELAGIDGWGASFFRVFIMMFILVIEHDGDS